MHLGLKAIDAGLLGLTIKRALTEGSFNFSSSDFGYCQVCAPSVVNSLAIIGLFLNHN